MTEKAQINLRVGEDQKEEWQQYVEESMEYTTLTDLSRTPFLTGVEQNDSTQEPQSPELASDIEQVKQDLERVRKDVRWLREQEQDEVDISDLAQDLYDELEPLPEPTSEINIPRGC